jgi:hypothetical protein
VTTAAELNAFLANDQTAFVQITTHGKSTLYRSKHAGWFSVDSKGGLYVRRGRSRDYLGPQDQPWVAIRRGWIR